jgi:hypothetical protein
MCGGSLCCRTTQLSDLKEKYTMSERFFVENLRSLLAQIDNETVATELTNRLEAMEDVYQDLVHHAEQLEAQHEDLLTSWKHEIAMKRETHQVLQDVAAERDALKQQVEDLKGTIVINAHLRELATE